SEEKGAIAQARRACEPRQQKEESRAGGRGGEPVEVDEVAVRREEALPLEGGAIEPAQERAPHRLEVSTPVPPRWAVARGLHLGEAWPFDYSWPCRRGFTTSGAISRARWSSCASVKFAMGCGTARNLYCGTPQAWAMAWPVASNTSVTMDAAGTPTFSNRIPSSTLPDEQDPQSPTPATTTSTPRLASSMISSWAGTLEFFLRHIFASAAPYSFFKISPILSSRRSELNLVFSTSPIRFPLSESGLGA